MKKETKYQIIISVISICLIVNSYLSYKWRNLAYRSTYLFEESIKLNKRAVSTTTDCRRALEVLSIRHGYVDSIKDLYE